MIQSVEKPILQNLGFNTGFFTISLDENERNRIIDTALSKRESIEDLYTRKHYRFIPSKALIALAHNLVKKSDK